MNVRIKGLDTKAELDQHFAELNEEAAAANLSEAGAANDLLTAPMREIMLLRDEVAHLQDLLSQAPFIDRRQRKPVEGSPWLRIAGTVAATFILGKIAQRLRLGAAGAAAVPFIVAQANGRIW